MRLLGYFNHVFASLINNYLQPFINSCVYLFYKKPILVNSWVDVNLGKVKNRNWGDDINVYLIETISNKKVLVKNQSLLHRYLRKENYICIGSILGLYEDENSIIWGSGFIDEYGKLSCKPRKICSVRGLYTRNILLKEGYDCPPIFGDPALLVSKYYKPTILHEPMYKIGFILHYVDANNPIISQYCQMHKDCIIISLSNYKKWTDVIDKICSCKFIVSSSLHGLIVSDSYGIPNQWVRLSEKIVGGDFKYHDYFSSVGREEILPHGVSSFADIEQLYDQKGQYKKITIDYEQILKSCPFL